MAQSENISGPLVCVFCPGKGLSLLLIFFHINFTHQHMPGLSSQLPIYRFCIDSIHPTTHPFLTFFPNFGGKRLKPAARQILIERVNCCNYSSALQTCSLVTGDLQTVCGFPPKHTAKSHAEGSPVPPTPTAFSGLSFSLKQPR